MSPSPEVRYYPAGNGWWGYTVYLNGRPCKGAECRSRRDAIKDAKIAVRQLKAETERRVG